MDASEATSVLLLEGTPEDIERIGGALAEGLRRPIRIDAVSGVPFICVAGAGEPDAGMPNQCAADDAAGAGPGRLPSVVRGALSFARAEAEKQKAERQLRQSVEMLEEAQHMAHTGSWCWHVRRDSVQWSRESYRLLGFDPDTTRLYRGISYKNMDEADIKRVEAALRATMTQGKPYDEEFAVWRDGKRAILHSWATVQFGADGAPEVIRGLIQDVTAQRLAEEARLRHETYSRAVGKLAQDFINMPAGRLDAAIDGAMGMVAEYCEADRIAVYRYDWDGEAALHRLEWDREPRYRTDSAFHAVPLRRLGAMMKRMAAGREFIGPEQPPEDLQARLDPAETRARSICALPMTEDGSLIGMVTACAMEREKPWSGEELTALRLFAGLMTSVIMRKEAEEALRQLAESYRLALDSTTDGVAMVDRDGIILNINSAFAARYGKREEDAVGHRFAELMPKEQCGDLFERRLGCVRRAYDSGKPVNDEDALAGLWFSNRYFPIFKDGRVAAVALFSADITNRKDAEEEARRRLETEARLNVMTEFFTNVSHELKTPLSLILMQLDMMRVHMGNAEKLKGLLTDATLNAYRLTRLVINLLDITKMDAGFLKLNPRSKDVVLMLRRIADSVREYAAQRGVTLEFICDAESKRMDFDADKLERAVLNLLSNALKHTPAGGRITLECRARDDSVSVCVRDSGEGIPADKLGIVFDRFAQVSNRLSRRTEGCGIGLALVKSIAELHGGTVRAESEMGRGSAFTMELPVRHAAHTERAVVIEGFDLKKTVKMELSDLYINTGG